MAKRRIKPELNLQPELPQVLSEDFNLFYKPQEEPEIAGLKEFTASLDNFISDAGTKIVLSKELKEKEVGSAQADKDFREVIGKNLEPATKFIASEALNDPSLISKLKNLIMKQSSRTTIGETRTAWAQPYISAMTFKEQAYGSM